MYIWACWFCWTCKMRTYLLSLMSDRYTMHSIEIAPHLLDCFFTVQSVGSSKGNLWSTHVLWIHAWNISLKVLDELDAFGLKTHLWYRFTSWMCIILHLWHWIKHRKTLLLCHSFISAKNGFRQLRASVHEQFCFSSSKAWKHCR